MDERRVTNLGETNEHQPLNRLRVLRREGGTGGRSTRRSAGVCRYRATCRLPTRRYWRASSSRTARGYATPTRSWARPAWT
jgi:hypothetical protein